MIIFTHYDPALGICDFNWFCTRCLDPLVFLLSENFQSFDYWWRNWRRVFQQGVLRSKLYSTFLWYWFLASRKYWNIFMAADFCKKKNKKKVHEQRKSITGCKLKHLRTKIVPNWYNSWWYNGVPIYSWCHTYFTVYTYSLF